VLESNAYHTGPMTCMTDTLAFILGYPILSEEDANAVATTWQESHENTLNHPAVQDALNEAQVVLRRIGKKGHTVKMQRILGQREGMFLVVFTGNLCPETRHCVAIDCLRRVAFCNQNGVYPFCLNDDERPETSESHTKLNDLLGVDRINAVYRVLVGVDKVNLFKAGRPNLRSHTTARLLALPAVAAPCLPSPLPSHIDRRRIHHREPLGPCSPLPS